MIKIAPSILSADFANLERDIGKITKAGADYVHIDVMDGHFVPNLTIGAPVVRAIRKVTDCPLDVHLMISNPDDYLDDFIEAGSDIITVHYESNGDTIEQLKKIRASGIKAAVSIKPNTPAKMLFPLLSEMDMALVMTVEPGFGGQAMILPTMWKIKELKEEIEKNGLHCLVEADGGVTLQNAPLLKQYGVDILVAGSAIFKASDLEEAIKGFHEL